MASLPGNAERYNTGQVKSLTGATKGQVDWWVRTGLIAPATFSPRRLYTFDELLKIRTLVELRRLGYSLPLLRAVMKRVEGLSEGSLTDVRLVDIDGDLYICRDWQEMERATDGQLVWSVIAFGEAAKELKRRLTEPIAVTPLGSTGGGRS